MCFGLFSKFKRRGEPKFPQITKVPSKFKMEFKTPFHTTGVSSEEAHPLLNRPVIVKSFIHLDVDDLKKCRLVCKSWNKIASHYLSDKTEFDCRRMNAKDMDKSLEALAKNMCILPQNFVYSFNSTVHQQTCKKFIKYYGHRINSLRLRPWESTKMFSRGDLCSLLLQCPYLQFIEFSALPEDLISGQSFFPKCSGVKYEPLLPNIKSLRIYGGANFSVEFMYDLLFSMPNLTDLKINEPQGKFIDQMFWLLKNPKINFKYLKNLEILRPVEFNNEHLIRVELCGFHLRVLNISKIQMVNSIGKIYLEPLLQTLAFTLEELTLPAFREESEVLKLNIPKMLFLKKLHLEDWKLFGNLEYVRRCFPNLATLVLDDVNEGKDEEDPLAIQDNLLPQLKLTELTLLNYLQDGDSLEEILKGFPQLKKLRLFVTDEILLIIFQFAENLEELHMNIMSLATDSGVTGITKKRCELLRNENFKAPVSHTLRRSRYSICDLSKLRKLTLACAVRNFFTDISILYGISQLSNLCELYLRNCVMSDFSLVALSQLPLLHLDLGSLDESSNITTIGLCYFQNQAPFTKLIYQFKPLETKGG